MSIEEIIRNLVLKLSDVNADDYQASMNFRDDFGIDSLDMVELIMTCEREFGIIIHDDELQLNQSPTHLTDLVKNKISEKNLA